MTKAKRTTDYQSLSSELEAILASLQSGELGIDEALKQYQEGMLIVEELQKYLKEAENKVIKIKQSFD